MLARMLPDASAPTGHGRSAPRRLDPRASLLVLVLLLPAGARAWNDEGHQVIGALAERRLGPAARAMVEEILGAGRLSDHDVAVWADDHRDRSNAPFHWVDIPFAEGRFDAARDCPDGMCAVARIEWAVETLTRAPDQEARLEALRWLVHVVGDLHQPLHAAEGWRHGNRGGVRLPAHVGERGYVASVHVLWDAEVVWPLLAGRRPAVVAAALDGASDGGRRAAWLADLAPGAWAGESNRLARDIYRELGVTPTQTTRIEVSEAYVLAQRSRVEAALARAGVRLAALLDRIAAERARLAGQAVAPAAPPGAGSTPP
jgi:hypothetical protein